MQSVDHVIGISCDQQEYNELHEDGCSTIALVLQSTKDTT